MKACPALTTRADRSVFQGPHWPQPGLQSAVISLDRIVDVLLDNMAGSTQQLIDHSWVDRCAVRTHLGWLWTMLQCAGEKPVGGGQISLLRHQHIDDCPYWSIARYRQSHCLATLICLMYEPAISGGMSAGSSRVDRQWGEPLHASVDGDVIHLDATLEPAVLRRLDRAARSAGTNEPQS